MDQLISDSRMITRLREAALFTVYITIGFILIAVALVIGHSDDLQEDFPL